VGTAALGCPESLPHLAGERRFSLDSALRQLLTLRNYSKVCFSHNHPFRSLILGDALEALRMFSLEFRRAGFVCGAVLAVLCVLPSALGQSTAGRIVGRVSDTTGAVVSGVTVTLTNVATGVSRSATTNDTGDYNFVEVTPGNYRVEYLLQGFKKELRTNLVLEINQVLTLNATLQPGGTQETVDVSSEAPLVDTTSTQLGAVVGERAVTELPLNTRDTYQFLQLQPGVMSTVGSSNTLIYGSDSPGAVSVNGGRGRSNNFSVNGGDANDLFVNLPTVQPSPDSIRSFGY